MTDAKTIVITRLFDAPRALVFECWLKPEHLLHWYSAGDGWTTPHARTDPRTGGRFNIGFGKTLITLTLTLETTHSEEQQRHGWSAMLENLNLYLERKAQ
jgi:hypothetical protein